MNTTDPEKRRDQNVTFRLSKIERAKLEAEGERRGVNNCDVIRDLLLEQPYMRE